MKKQDNKIEKYNYEELSYESKENAYKNWLNDFDCRDAFSAINYDIKEFNRSKLPCRIVAWDFDKNGNGSLDLQVNSEIYLMTQKEIFRHMEKYVQNEPVVLYSRCGRLVSKVFRKLSGNTMEKFFAEFWRENCKIAMKEGIDEFFQKLEKELRYRFLDIIYNEKSQESFEEYYAYLFKYDKDGNLL